MKKAKPNTVVILDDDKYIIDVLLKSISRLPLAKGLSFKGFTNDSKAHEFVLQRREWVLGYIQDINRQPDGRFDIYDKSGIRFFHQVIDCLTPWAKTIILSGCCDVSVPSELFKKGSDRLRWIQKSKVTGIQTLVPHLEWLTIPANEESNRTDPITSSIVAMLRPAWDKLCEYLAVHPDQLHHLNPRDFEYLAGEIFRSYGWAVDFTARTRDGGYDIIATRRSQPSDLCVLVQAKRYAPNRPIGVDIVRSLYGLRTLHSVSQVVLVTSSYVTKDAKKEFKRVIPWELDFIERDRILEWCRDYTSILVEGWFEGRSHQEPKVQDC